LLVARWRPPQTAACHVRLAAADATRYGRRRCYCSRAPPLQRLLLPPPVLLRLLVLLYSQFGGKKLLLIKYDLT